MKKIKKIKYASFIKMLIVTLMNKYQNCFHGTFLIKPFPFGVLFNLSYVIYIEISFYILNKILIIN